MNRTIKRALKNLITENINEILAELDQNAKIEYHDDMSAEPENKPSTFKPKKDNTKSNAQLGANKYDMINNVTDHISGLYDILAQNDMNNADKGMINWSSLSTEQISSINNAITSLKSFVASFMKG
jgi:hypothetical protein